ncbi:MAG: hypothetical protein OXG40_12830 [Acidimicrobiaceae bacterium]|nr:hypothetical protein [Acidimicrobiaceae bacterium]MDE0514716.1 hypothetical protein [Acidimicrobiaceae bacterium]MDE0656727.1 hypothetical protein [Acidimicrobiaceae bacterium]
MDDAMAITIEYLRDEWLEYLKREIGEIHLRRHIHGELDAMLATQHCDTTFWSHYHRMYVESQVMAIRRLSDDDSRTMSFVRFIREIGAYHHLVSRDAYVARWVASVDHPSDVARRMANNQYDNFTGCVGDDEISQEKLERDVATLARRSESLRRFADQYVAHFDRDRREVQATYDDLDSAIDELCQLLKHYHLLLNQGALMSCQPVIQGDWTEPFRQPLAEPLGSSF